MFNRHQIVIAFLHAICLSIDGAYLFHEANSMEEYMYLFFILITEVGVLICYVSLAYKNDKVFDLLDMFERLLNESEFQFLWHPTVCTLIAH